MSRISTARSITPLLAALVLTAYSAAAVEPDDDPAVASWLINTDGTVGTSPDAEMEALVSLIEADVLAVFYTDDDVYVDATGVPSYPTGPFGDGNPAYAGDVDTVRLITRLPEEDTTGNNRDVRLGAIGVFVNGVAVFNASDAMSYANQGIWNRNAVVAEADGFDAALGHPAGGMGGGGALIPGTYHHHQQPVLLREQLGDDGFDHSPILGFAFDGFPIYGPYGYDDPNGSGGIVRLESSYRLRDITVRETLPDGTTLAPALYGPPVNATYPLSLYQEDFEYVSGFGHLDENNSRFAVTPEYPDGTFTYIATIDALGDAAYPYFLGPFYTGFFVNQNNVTIPAEAVEYVPEPRAEVLLIAGVVATLALRGRAMERRRSRRRGLGGR
jgi:hypothetical protein